LPLYKFAQNCKGIFFDCFEVPKVVLILELRRKRFSPEINLGERGIQRENNGIISQKGLSLRTNSTAGKKEKKNEKLDI
jgi:hypothetical protein